MKKNQYNLIHRGVVLPMVLIAVALLGLMAAGLAVMAEADAVSAATAVRRGQARLTAESGIARTIGMLIRHRDEPAFWQQNKTIFSGVSLTEEDEDGPKWRFSITHPSPERGLRKDHDVFGVEDESGKINVNVADAEMLATLPGIGPEQAEEIIAWREGEGGRFAIVGEVLKVPGFDDDDGGKAIRFLTVWSAENNVDDAGEPRININGDAEEIRRELKGKVSDKLIAFLVAARKAGLTFEHPVDLLGSEEVNHGDKTFSSPVTPETLDSALNTLTTAEEAVFTGRVNVMTAPSEVLLAAGLTESEAKAVLRGRYLLSAPPRTTAWLIRQEALSVERFKEVSPRLTVRSRQFRFAALGRCDGSLIRARIEVVVDIRGEAPRILFRRDAGFPELTFRERSEEQ